MTEEGGTPPESGAPPPPDSPGAATPPDAPGGAPPPDSPGAAPPPGSPGPATAGRFHDAARVLRGLPGWAKIVSGAAVVVVIVLLVLLLTGGGAGGPLAVLSPPPTSLADPVPYDGRSPVQPPGDEQRVLVQMPRPALGDLKGARSMSATRQRRYVASLEHEAEATRSALGANGVVLRHVVSYGLVWNGFAATIRTRDLARLNTPGTRVRTVRRLYPATSDPVPVPGAPPKGTAAGGQAPVAVLDTGVEKALEGERGYDAVDRDRDAAPGRDPSGTGRRETSGTALAGVLAAAGERVLPIRVASLRPAPGRAVEAVGTTDELLAGLERAVDPDGDGDTSDHVPVALVGVNAPYAGFDTTPEAQAIAGAAGLGTLVVAPAGNEGAGNSTVGSPGAAEDALAVGALAGPEPAPRVPLEADGHQIATAAVLGGAPPTDGLTTAGPVTSASPAELGKQAQQLRGKAVIVRAGADPSAQAAAAANTGARVVLLADPRDRALPAVAAGRAAVAVIGVTGDGADALVKLAPGTSVRLGAVERGPTSDAPAQPRTSPSTAQGPSAGGLPKPEIAAPGTAVTAGVGGGAVVAGGTAVAAARVAAAAAKLARLHPDLTPAELRAALIGGADPAALPVERTGAGALRTTGLAGATSSGGGAGGSGGGGGAGGSGGGAFSLGAVTADPPAPVSGPLDPIAFAFSVASTTELALRTTPGSAVQPPQLTVRPGVPAGISVRLTQAGATGEGRLEALSAQEVVASVPWLVRPLDVPPVPLGPLKAAKGRVTFTLGSFERGDPLTSGSKIALADKLVLQLVDARDHVQRTLTVPGGARGLMPAEYAYTLPKAALEALPKGTYAFRARAWAPRQREPTERRSNTFTR